jgi:hypothetical protein
MVHGEIPRTTTIDDPLLLHLFQILTVKVGSIKRVMNILSYLTAGKLLYNSIQSAILHDLIGQFSQLN